MFDEKIQEIHDLFKELDLVEKEMKKNNTPDQEDKYDDLREREKIIYRNIKTKSEQLRKVIYKAEKSADEQLLNFLKKIEQTIINYSGEEQ